MATDNSATLKRPWITLRMSRRRFIFDMALVGLVSYSFGLETGWFEVTTKIVRLPSLQTGTRVRLLHLSDMHAAWYFPWSALERAVRMAVETKPDIICLTGDYVTYKADLDKYAQVLRPLAQVAPVYASFGNHDGGPWASRFYRGYNTTEPMAAMLRQAGITPLKNQSVLASVAGQQLALVGMGDYYEREVKPVQAFAQVRDLPLSVPIVVLAHNSDTKRHIRHYRWELMLSGHTHAGQVKIPFLGAPIINIDDKQFAEGLVPWVEGKQIHTTRGVGNLLGIRFNCRPEISVLELVG
jgi:predicted MPP superfamily phosphohydrolase